VDPNELLASVLELTGGELINLTLPDLNETSLLNAALIYAERGWPVLPLHPRDKTPLGRLVPNGLNNASTDQDEITTWWSDSPQANIGLRTGVAFDVLDLDGPAAIQSLKGIAPAYKHPGPVSSTGKGFHLLFLPTGARNAAAKLPGIDFRGQSGYIVAPPSVHPHGHSYLWRRDGPLPEPTPWLDQLVTKPRAQRSTPVIDPDSQTSIVYLFMDLLGSIRNLEAIGSRFRTSCIFPDHEDSTPSFVLYPENNSFYCFGCDEWGDSLDLERSFKSGLLPPSSWRTAASAA
jgi:hypothetical protein